MANELIMTRGDTLILAVDILDENGAAYNPAVTDAVTLTIMEWSDTGVISLQKHTGDADVDIVTGGWGF